MYSNRNPIISGKANTEEIPFRKTLIYFIVFYISGFQSCEVKTNIPPESLVSISSFDVGQDGWIASFADYPLNRQEFYKMNSEFSGFRASSGNYYSAIQLTEFCENSQTFSYIKKNITGLEPNTRYNIELTVQLYLQLNQPYTQDDLSLIDKGSFLKAGAFTNDPENDTISNMNNPEQMLIVPGFDKGINFSGGSDMIYLNKIDIVPVGGNPSVAQVNNLNTPISVKSDNKGSIWMAIGLDTNVPIYFTAYYTLIGLQFLKTTSN